MLYTIVAVLVLVLDQAVKFWTVKTIPPMAADGATVSLIPGVLHMTNVQNNGAAFSILADQRWLLVGVSAVFIIGIIVLISMDIIHTKFGRWTAVLVMAGALGNCIDRVLYGYVVDMFEFELFSFAVFNVADIFITVCGILFCIHVIVYREPIEEYNAVPRKSKKRRRRDEPEDDYDEYQDEYDDYDEYEDEEEEDVRPSRHAAARSDRAPAKAKGRAKAKEDPYANIPRRGQHRSLEDELRLENPDDPFAEWSDSGKAKAPRKARTEEPEPTPVAGRRTRPSQAQTEEQAPPRRRAQDEEPEQAPVAGRRTRPSQAQTEAPRRRPAAPEAEWDDLDVDLDQVARKPAPQTKRQAAPQRPAQQSAKKPSAPDAGFDEYSLEDILAEFRDN